MEGHRLVDTRCFDLGHRFRRDDRVDKLGTSYYYKNSMYPAPLKKIGPITLSPTILEQTLIF